MKKLLLLIFLLAGMTAYGQISESFDNTTTPTGWSTSGTTGWSFNPFSGAVPNYAMSGTADHTGNSGSYAWCDGSWPYPGISVLQSPTFNGSALTNPGLIFYWKSDITGYSTTFNNLYIDVYNGTSWVGMDTLARNSASRDWEKIQIDLSGLSWSGTSHRVRFRLNKNGSTPFYNDVAIDDVVVKSIVNRDASVKEIQIPKVACKGASDSLVITLINEGKDTLTSTSINWTLNGVSQTALSWTGSLATGDQATVKVGNFTHPTTGTSHKIAVWTSGVNGSTDQNMSNDTSANDFGFGMSGTVTVAASGADYTKIQDALNDVMKFGLCGPLVIKVAAGTYTEQLTIGSVLNSSSVNTITIMGAGEASTTVTHSVSLFSADRATVIMDGTSYVTFRDMTIKSTGTTYGWGVHFFGANSNCRLIKCTVEVNGTSTSGNIQCIVNSNSKTGYSTSGHKSTNITVDSCTVKNGWSGYICYGQSANLHSDITISNSTFTNQYNYGIFQTYAYTVTIHNNSVDMRSTGSTFGYGIFCSRLNNNSTAGTALGSRITENTVKRYGRWGIFMDWSQNTSASKGLIANNMIVGPHMYNYSGTSLFSTPAALRVYYGGNWNIYHNTCNMGGPVGGTAYGALVYQTSNFDVRNNIFSCQSTTGSNSRAFYCNYSPSSTRMIDYNAYWNGTRSTLMYTGGNRTSSTLNTYSTNGDQNSVHINPPFVSSSDLHLSDACFDKGISLAAVTTDIDGQTRGSSPHIGCDEIPTSSLDAGVVEILSPKGVVSSGAQLVRIAVKNFGTTSLTDAEIKYQVTGSSTVSETINFLPSLGNCSLDTFTFSTTYTHTSGCAEISAWTESPNSSTDQNTSNDKSGPQKFGIPMSGTYTIGGTGPDFVDFDAAMEGLACAGINGAVVFNVRSGTYNTQLDLKAGDIPGISSSNTVKFQSDPSNTTMPLITYESSSSTANYIVRFNGITYVTFDGLHFRPTNATYGRAFEFLGNNSYITISNNKIEGVKVTTSSNWHALIYDNTSTSNMSNFVTITGNTFTNGAYAIYAYGGSSSSFWLQDSWVVTNNTATNFYYYGFYFYYMKELKVEGNSLSTNSVSTFGYGMYFRYCDGGMRVAKNRIVGIQGGYGMYFYFCDATSGSPAYIQNNFIQVGRNSFYTARAIYAQYNRYQKYYHNTLVGTSTSTSSSNATFWMRNNSSFYAGNELMNNSITGRNYVLYLYSTTYSYITSDYNNIWSQRTSGTIIFAGSSYSSLTAYSAARSLDGNSKSVDPLFVTVGQPTMLSTDLDSAGSALAAVTDDINGKTRRSPGPSIGCEEYTVESTDCGIVSVDQPTVACATNSATVTIKNFGSDTLKSATIQWTVDGVTQSAQGFVGALALGQEAQINLGSFTTSGSGPFNIVAWTILPNAMVDPKTENDTATKTITLGMSGTYTVGTGTSDYPTVEAAVNAVMAQGVCGPVVFKVAPGTYTEQVEIGAVVGSSATNTVTFEPASGVVTIQHAAVSSVSNYVVKFNGGANVIFRNIVFRANATFSSYSRCIEFQSMNDNVMFDGCSFMGRTNIFTTSNWAALIYDWTGTANMTHNVTIKNCKFNGGSYAIYSFGGSTSSKQNNWRIMNNDISDVYYMGIYSFYNDSITFTKNKIRFLALTQSFTTYGIYTYYNGNVRSISYNDVVMRSNNSYGMYLYFMWNASGDSALITNNFISLNNATASSGNYGVYLYQSRHIFFAHNNVRITSGFTLSSAGSALYAYTSSSSYGNYYFYNNNFVATKALTISAFYNISTSSIWFAQNNNYSATYHAYRTTAYTTVAALATASGKNIGAVEYDPMFVSGTDLHINNINLGQAGQGKGVTDDIDADSRDATTPTIGAHEIDPDIAVIDIDEVKDTCGPKSANQFITVDLKNNGDIDLVDIPMELSLNGGTPIHDTVRVTIPAGGTASFAFSQSIDISAKQDHSVKVTANPLYDVVSADNSNTMTIEYWPIPDASFTYSETCLGASTSFKGTSTHTGTTNAPYSVTYAWDFGDGNTGAGPDVTHAYAANGTYKVLLTVTSNNGCKDTISQFVTISDMTPGSISASQIICSGATPAALQEVTAPGGSTGSYTFQWQMSTNSGSTWTDITGANASTYSPGAISTETQFRREAESVSGCGPVYSNAVTISLFSPGVAGTIGFDETICYGTSPSTLLGLTLPTGGDGNYTHQWQSSTNGSTFSDISGATSNDYSPGNLTTTTWFRRVDNSCNDDNTNVIKITVHPKLVAGAITGDQTVCPNGVPTQFTEASGAVGGDGTYTYQWQSSPDKVVWTNIAGATSADYQAGAISSNTWFRRNDISGSSCGIESTQAILVEVAPLPVPDFILATHCFGDPMPVTNRSSISSGSITAYEWDFGDGNSSTLRVPNHTYTTAGTYTVKLIITSNYGCKDSTTRTIKISSIPTPTFNAFYDCSEDSMRFKNTTITTCGSITGFFWDFGDGNSSTMTNPSHKYATPGTYSVKLRITVPGGFTDSTTKSVTIETPGTADFTTKDVCFGEDVQFTNNSLNAVSYSWDFGDNTSSTVTGPTHFYRVIGKYTVKLHVTDGNGCVSTMTKQVEVKVKPFADFTTDNRCDAQAVPFVNGTLYADSYLWDFGDATTSTTKNPNHVYPNDGSYNVTLYADNNNGCKDTFYGSVVVYPLPVAGFTTADGCDGHAVNFTNTSTGASTYDWTFGDMTTSTATNPSHTYPGTGTYTVQLFANTIHGCEDTTAKVVTVHPSPVVDFSASTACDGEATTFTNNSSISAGTMTYSWDFGDGNMSSAASPAHTYGAAGKYTVVLTVTGSGGNCTESMTKTVTVNETPTASFTGSNVCDGSAVSFTNSSTGATAYMWDFGDGNTAPGAAPSHTYASAGTYTVTLTVSNAYNCKSSTTQSITVYDKPAAGFTATTECIGDITAFTNTSSIGTGTMTYLWDFGDGISSNASDPTHTYGLPGNYLVTLTVTSNNNCVSSIVKNVTVHDRPVAHFNTQGVCVGQTTPFVNNTVGAVSYSWDFGDGSFSSQHSPGHQYAAAGTYVVMLTATNAQGCTNQYTQTVIVWAKPTANFTNTDVCVGSIMPFSNSSSTGTYAWDFGDGFVSSQANPSHIYKKAGNYNVTLEVINTFGCEATVTKQVTAYAEPVAAFNAPGVCQGTNASFTNTSAGAVSYAWNFGDGNTSSATNPTHNYNTSGNYIVTLEATNSNGCKNTVQNNIMIYARPRASFTANTGCLGQVTRFDNTSDGGSYVWDFGDGAGSTRPDPTHVYSTPGTYTVTLTVTNENGCVNSTTNTVVVSPIPTADFSAAAQCSGPTAQFTNNSSISGGSMNFNWDFGDGSSDNTPNPNKTYAQGGNYVVTLAAVSANGCAASITKVVTVYDLATPSFEAGNVCEGKDVIFVNTSKNTSSAAWEFGDGNTSNAIAPTHKYATIGTYSVKLTVKNAIGCETSVVNSVKVSANPTANFNAPDACERTDITFNNSSTGASAYDWSLGDGTTSGAPNPVHQYAQAGTKRVTLTAISADGCTDEVTGTITIYQRPIAKFEVSNTCFGDVTRFKNTSLNGSSYTWDFGDGNNSTITHPTHTYGSTGPNDVKLTVSNANCDDELTVTVDILSLPVSTFSHTVNGRDVSFTPTTTTNISDFKWNFGDGSSGTGSSVNHTYANAVVKTFTACLQTTGTNGCISESCDDVKIDLLGLDATKATEFAIFPNPNTGKFQIQLGDVEGELNIEITDLIGKTIKVVDTSVIRDNYDVDLGHVAEGVYMVIVRNGETISTKKIVVNN